MDTEKIQSGTAESGMQTFDKHLLELYCVGAIDRIPALDVATIPQALALERRQRQGIAPGK